MSNIIIIWIKRNVLRPLTCSRAHIPLLCAIKRAPRRMEVVLCASQCLDDWESIFCTSKNRCCGTQTMFSKKGMFCEMYDVLRELRHVALCAGAQNLVSGLWNTFERCAHKQLLLLSSNDLDLCLLSNSAHWRLRTFGLQCYEYIVHTWPMTWCSRISNCFIPHKHTYENLVTCHNTHTHSMTLTFITRSNT